MGIEKCPRGFRARVKKGHRTFSGPVRETEAAAGEDEIQYKQAAAESLEEVQKLHETFFVPGPSSSIQKHRNCWRARIIKAGQVYFGPGRTVKELAESDGQQLVQAGRVSSDAVEVKLRELRGVELVERKAEGFEAVMRLHLQSLLLGNISGMSKTEQKRLQRARQQDEYKNAFEASELLVKDQQATEMLAQEHDASWLRELGMHLRLESGSRPLGIAGFYAPVMHCGLRNLGNSCWLNAIVQCLYHCPPLQKDLSDPAAAKGPLGRLLRELFHKMSSKQWDYMWRLSSSWTKSTRRSLLFFHPARVLMLEIAVSYSTTSNLHDLYRSWRTVFMLVVVAFSSLDSLVSHGNIWREHSCFLCVAFHCLISLNSTMHEKHSEGTLLILLIRSVPYCLVSVPFFHRRIWSWYADAGQKILCDNGLHVVSDLPDDVGTQAVTVAEIMRETFQAQWPSAQALVLQLTMPRTDGALDWKETIVTSCTSSEVSSAVVRCICFCHVIWVIEWSCLLELFLFKLMWSYAAGDAACQIRRYTGFVQFLGNHFVAFVRKGSKWHKCDDSTVTPVDDVPQIWPILIFLEKFRKQRFHLVEADSSVQNNLPIPRLPVLLRKILTADASSRNFAPETTGRTSRSRSRKTRLLQFSSLVRKAICRQEVFCKRRHSAHDASVEISVKKRKRDRTGRKQSRNGRKQSRKGRTQERSAQTQDRSATNTGEICTNTGAIKVPPSA